MEIRLSLRDYDCVEIHTHPQVVLFNGVSLSSDGNAPREQDVEANDLYSNSCCGERARECIYIRVCMYVCICVYMRIGQHIRTSAHFVSVHVLKKVSYETDV